jgi:hypothetical protein
MKKKLFISLIACFAFITANAQINKLSGYDEIGWPSGYYPEGQNGTFVLEKDGDAIKVVSQAPATALAGKFNHRFTPSVNGEYTLKFKAKKDGTDAQNIKINLLRTDAWTDLVSPQTDVSIDSSDFKDYTVTFVYREDIKAKTPQCFQLEIYVNGVLGNLWFKDINLYESNNNQVTYTDDFEADLYWGLYQLNGNSWERTPKTAAEKGELKKVKPAETTMLQYTQQIGFADPWNATVTRTWWAQRGVQYRVKFDISSSVTMPSAGGIGLEIWDGTNKIRPAEYFEVTPTMQTKDFITGKVVAEFAYSATFFVGKLPAAEKMFLDNVLIAPIYLYNATVADVKENAITVNWLHSGYLAGDKMDVSLVNGTDTTLLKQNVEIISGSLTADLPISLDPNKQYKIYMKDKVGAGNYVVNNITESQKFMYIPTGVIQNNASNIVVYVADGLLNISNIPVGSTIKVYSLTGRLEKAIVSTNFIETLKINKGVYIVQVNEKTFKVIM